MKKSFRSSARVKETETGSGTSGGGGGVLRDSFVVKKCFSVSSEIFRVSGLTLGRFPEQGLGTRLEINEKEFSCCSHFL